MGVHIKQINITALPTSLQVSFDPIKSGQYCQEVDTRFLERLNGCSDQTAKQYNPLTSLQVSFDPIKGGQCCQVVFTRFLEPVDMEPL